MAKFVPLSSLPEQKPTGSPRFVPLASLPPPPPTGANPADLFPPQQPAPAPVAPPAGMFDVPGGLNLQPAPAAPYAPEPLQPGVAPPAVVSPLADALQRLVTHAPQLQASIANAATQGEIKPTRQFGLGDAAQAMGEGLVPDLLGAPSDLYAAGNNTFLAALAAAGNLIQTGGKVAGFVPKDAPDLNLNGGMIQNPIGGSQAQKEAFAQLGKMVGVEPLNKYDLTPGSRTAYDATEMAASALPMTRAAEAARVISKMTPMEVAAANAGYAKPLPVATGKEFVQDVAGAAGAGVGQSQVEQDGPNANPLMTIAAMLAGSHGASAATSLAAKPGEILNAIKRGNTKEGAQSLGDIIQSFLGRRSVVPDEGYNGPPKALLDNAGPTRRESLLNFHPSQSVMDQTAQVMQDRAINPAAAAAKLEQRASDAKTLGDMVPDSFSASGDEGLISAGTALRSGEGGGEHGAPVPAIFAAHDRRLADKNTADVASLRVPGADQRAPQRLAEDEATIRTANATRDQEAAIQAQEQGVRKAADEGAVLKSRAGTQGDASEQADRVIAETLRRDQKKRSDLYDLGERAASESADATPLKVARDTIVSEAMQGPPSTHKNALPPSISEDLASVLKDKMDEVAAGGEPPSLEDLHQMFRDAADNPKGGDNVIPLPKRGPTDAQKFDKSARDYQDSKDHLDGLLAEDPKQTELGVYADALKAARAEPTPDVRKIRYYEKRVADIQKEIDASPPLPPRRNLDDVAPPTQKPGKVVPLAPRQTGNLDDGMMRVLDGAGEADAADVNAALEHLRGKINEQAKRSPVLKSAMDDALQHMNTGDLPDEVAVSEARKTLTDPEDQRAFDAMSNLWLHPDTAESAPEAVSKAMQTFYGDVVAPPPSTPGVDADIASGKPRATIRQLQDIRANASKEERAAREEGDFGKVDRIRGVKKGVDETIDQFIADNPKSTAAKQLKKAKEFDKTEFDVWLHGTPDEYRQRFNQSPDRRDASPPTATLDYFIKSGHNGAKEAAADLAAIKERATTPAKLRDSIRDYFTASAAQTVRADGVISANALRAWRNRYGQALSQFPDLNDEFKALSRQADGTQKTLGKLAADVRAKREAFRATQGEINKMALAPFLDTEPKKAVAAILNGKDPEVQMRAVLQRIGKDTAARDGLKDALSEHLYDTVTGSNAAAGAEGVAVSASKMLNKMDQYGKVLKQVYSPEEMATLERVQRTLRDMQATAVRAGRGSTTVDRFAAAKNSIEALIRLKHGALEGGSIVKRFRLMLSMIPGVSTEEKVNRVLLSAAFDPQLAASLLRRPPQPEGMKLFATQIANRMAALGGVRESVDDDEKQMADADIAPPVTKLSGTQEAAYQKWLGKIGMTKAAGMNMTDDGTGTDYDMRGFFKKYGPVDVEKGQHFTDEFKLPNHPTFSVESRFARGKDKAKAGSWNGDEFVPAKR